MRTHLARWSLPVLFALLVSGSVGREPASAQVMVAPPTAAADESLGHLSEPPHWQFHGAKGYQTEDLRNILWWDLNVQLTLTPGFRRNQLIAVMANRLTRYFTAEGFLDAKVSAAVTSSGDLEFTIDEGTHYRAGEIEVVGNKTIASALLTKEEPAESAPEMFGTVFDRDKGTLSVVRGSARAPSFYWEKDGPVGEAQIWLTVIQGEIQRRLTDAGYFWAQTHVGLVPHADGTAALRITIEREGPLATLGEINIQGLTQSRKEDVLKLLELRTGMPLKSRQLGAAVERLWDCGRFTRHDLTLHLQQGVEGRADLTLELAEIPGVPALHEPLMESDQAILRYRAWLNALPEGKDELVLDLPAKNFTLRAVFDPDVGILVHASPTGSDVAQKLHAGLIFSREQLGVFSTNPDHKFLVPGGKFQPQISFELAPKRFSFGAGVDSRFVGTSPLLVQLTLAPAAFLNAAHEPGTKVEIKEGVLTLTSASNTTRIDSATGRLLDMTTTQSKVSTDRGAYEREIQTMLAETTNRNEYDLKAPIASFLRFATPLVINLTGQGSREQRAVAGTAMQKILSNEALDALNSSLISSYESAPRLNDLDPTLLQSSEARMAFFFVPLCSQHFRRESWPWTVSRQALFSMIGRGQLNGIELERVFNAPDTGPLGFLATAEMLQLGGMGGVQAFAARGLQHLDTADFLRDCRALFPAGSPQERALLEVVRNLRNLDDGELDALSAAIPHLAKVPLRDIRRQMPAARGADIGGLLTDLEKNLWESGLRAIVQQRLQYLANPPSDSRI